MFLIIKAINVLAVKNKAAMADELVTPNALLVRSGNTAIILVFSLNQEAIQNKSRYCFTQKLEINF